LSGETATGGKIQGSLLDLVFAPVSVILTFSARCDGLFVFARRRLTGWVIRFQPEGDEYHIQETVNPAHGGP
jgi:hypothetical protein